MPESLPASIHSMGCGKSGRGTCSIVLVVMHFTNAVLIGLAKDFVNMQV
jgi:hypothetical protein